MDEFLHLISPYDFSRSSSKLVRRLLKNPQLGDIALMLCQILSTNIKDMYDNQLGEFVFPLVPASRI